MSVDLNTPAPAGTRITYAATVDPGTIKSVRLTPADSVVADVQADLQNHWGINVEQSQWRAGLFSGNFDVSLELLCVNSYAKVADVMAVVSGSFYNMGGSTVESAEIVDVTPIGQTKQTTGAPSATGAGAQNQGTGFTFSTETILLVFMIVVVFVVGSIVVLSPTALGKAAGSFGGDG